MRKKVILITNLPAVYRMELYKELSNDSNIDFLVYFYALNKEYATHCLAIPNEQINYSTIKTIVAYIKERRYFIPLNLIYKLWKNKPDILITVGFSYFSILCFFYAKIFNAKNYIWWAGTLLSEKNKPNIITIFRKWIVHKTSGIISYSNIASKYLNDKLNYQKNVLTLGNINFDMQQFNNSVAKYKHKKQTNKTTFLINSNLIPRKNVIFAIDVLNKVYQTYPNIHIILIGSGEEKEAILQKIKKINLPVEYYSHVTYDKIFLYYAQSDILLHPCKMDLWPQVINEALASELLVFTSPYCGVDEEVLNNANSFILPLDETVWVEAISTILNNTSIIESYRQKIRQTLIPQFTITKTKEKLCYFILR